MRKTVLAAIAALTLAPMAPAAAMPPMTAPSPLVSSAPVHAVAIFCGPLGCGPIRPGPRPWHRDWGPGSRFAGHVYRPACPLDYYYGCRRGPLGYDECGCWPYRTW